MNITTRNIFRAAIVVLIIVVVVVVIKLLVEPSYKSSLTAERGNDKPINSYENSLTCQPCSSGEMIKRAKEVIAGVKDHNKFRGGRATNTANACKRSNCEKITPLCFTFENEVGKHMERELLTEVGKDPKCGNNRLDARGKKSNKGLPIFLYIKEYRLSAEAKV